MEASFYRRIAEIKSIFRQSMRCAIYFMPLCESMRGVCDTLCVFARVADIPFSLSSFQISSVYRHILLYSFLLNFQRLLEWNEPTANCQQLETTRYNAHMFTYESLGEWKTDSNLFDFHTAIATTRTFE